MLHAHCEITVPIEKSCTDAYDEVLELIEQNKDTAEPPGNYKRVGRSRSDHSYIWAERVTANGKYTDDVIFEFNAAAKGDCKIHAKSRSQSLS